MDDRTDVDALLARLRLLARRTRRQGLGPHRLVLQSACTLLIDAESRPVLRFLEAVADLARGTGGTALCALEAGTHSPDEVEAVRGPVGGTVCTRERGGRLYARWEAGPDPNATSWVLGGTALPAPEGVAWPLTGSGRAYGAP